jgi:hypothetical protein
MGVGFSPEGIGELRRLCEAWHATSGGAATLRRWPLSLLGSIHLAADPAGRPDCSRFCYCFWGPAFGSGPRGDAG